MATKRMLIDASHPEETRVAIVSRNHLEDFDVEVESRKQLRGNIYLAKVTRVEPSLQATFVDYGGTATVSWPLAKSTPIIIKSRSPTNRRCWPNSRRRIRKRRPWSPEATQ